MTTGNLKMEGSVDPDGVATVRSGPYSAARSSQTDLEGNNERVP